MTFKRIFKNQNRKILQLKRQIKQSKKLAKKQILRYCYTASKNKVPEKPVVYLNERNKK